MLVFVGLGNPGTAYAATRHNIGRRVVAHAAARWSVSLASRGAAQQGRGHIHEHPVVLALPDTFMNVSGDAVEALMRAHDAQCGDVVVVHDDLDLPVGHLRIKSGGGAGGHNGVRSIVTALGADDFLRVKIGIGRPDDPSVDPADFVLAPFTQAEADTLPSLMTRAVDCLEYLAVQGVRDAMNHWNRRAPE